MVLVCSFPVTRWLKLEYILKKLPVEGPLDIFQLWRDYIGQVMLQIEDVTLKSGEEEQEFNMEGPE